MAVVESTRDRGRKSQVLVSSPGRRETQWLDSDNELMRVPIGETVVCWGCRWVLRERVENEGHVSVTLEPG